MITEATEKEGNTEFGCDISDVPVEAQNSTTSTEEKHNEHHTPLVQNVSDDEECMVPPLESSRTDTEEDNVSSETIQKEKNESEESNLQPQEEAQTPVPTVSELLLFSFFFEHIYHSNSNACIHCDLAKINKLLLFVE